MIDPVHLTPYYDAALCQALVNTGWSVRQFTSPYLYDKAFQTARPWEIDYLYGRGLSWGFWLSYPRLRRSLRTIMYLSGHRQLLQRIEKQSPDVVHLQWSRIPSIDRILIDRIRQLGVPLVHTVHDVEPLFAHASQESLAQVYRRVDRLIVHTYANRDALVSQYPIEDASRVQVVPHIAIDFPMPSGANSDVARRELGIPANAPVILFFGTVRDYKGLDVLMEAYRYARHFRPDLWLIVAGLHERGYATGNHDSQMILHPYYVPSDRVWLYHAAADVAVFPYRRVTQSGALITAMGFGLPVVVTNVGGLRETLYGNGWVVPPEAPKELGSALVDAVSSTERLRQMGQCSIERVRTSHAPELVAGLTVSLYGELIRTCSASSTVPTV